MSHDEDDAEYLRDMAALDEENQSIPSEEEESPNHEWDKQEKKIKTDDEEVKEEEENNGPALESLYGFDMPINEVWYRKQLLHWAECDEHVDHKGRSKPLPRLEPEHPFDTAKLLPRVWMDVARGDTPLGRMVFILFPSVAPHACENFRALCTGEKGLGRSGQPLHFKGTYFFKIISHYFCQGGDTTMGDGSGGESIWGEHFKDELSHGKIALERGHLITANSGPDTNQSQFCVLFDEAEWLEDTATVFGVLDEGPEVLYLVEQTGLESTHVDPTTKTPTRAAAKSPFKHGGETHDPVTITDCGQLVLILTKTRKNGKPSHGCKWVVG